MTINEKNACSRCMRFYEEDGACPHCGYAPNTRNPAFALEERTVLDKRYVIGAVIGAGGFGITYAAWDRTLHMPVAVKEFYPRELVTRDNAEDDEIILLPGEENRAHFHMALDRFEREAHVLAMLQSVPGIVTVLNWFRANGTAYLVMEYLRGQTLGEYCRWEKPDWKRLLGMLRQPIDALVICHQQGVLHRDVSPANLFVLQDGTVKLIDFGAAAQMARQAKGQDQSVLLNRRYAPIEQYDEHGHQGPWTDVYALCATLFALMNGSPAPEAPLRKPGSLPGLKELPIPKDARRALERGMAVQPESRTQSMEELRASLYHLPMPEEIQRRRRFVRRFTGIAAAALLLAAGLLFNFTTGLPLGGDLLYSLGCGGWQITSALHAQPVQTLPASKLGLPVTSIADGAFMGDETLQRLTIPGSIAQIGERAFFGCSALETVTLQEGVTAVGESAFASCPQLHTFAVPYSLTHISPNALKGASDMLAVWGERDMPAHELLGQAHLFAVRSEYRTEPNETGVTLTQYTDALESERADGWTVILPSYIDGQPVTRIEGSYVGENAQKEPRPSLRIPANAGRVVLPQMLEVQPRLGGFDGERGVTVVSGRNVKAIAPHSVTSDVTAVELPNGLETIGEYAFYQTQMTSVTLPGTVREIGAHAFQYSSLESIALPQSVVCVGEEAFRDIDSLAAITLTPSLTELPRRMLYDCTYLKSLVLPEGLKRIGEQALYHTGLEYICLPESVEYVGPGAFGACYDLRYVYIPEHTVVDETAFELGNLMPALQPAHTAVIAGYPGSDAERIAQKMGVRFEDASRWNAFPSPDTPGRIAANVADYEEMVCASFDAVHNVFVTHVEAPGASDALRSVDLPLFVEEIGMNSFTNCPSLEAIDLPETLEKIGLYSFSGSGLKELVLPESLVEVEECVFSYCEQLASLTFPSASRLHELPGDGFGGCFDGLAIEELVIPYNMKVMESAFKFCPNLKKVVINEGCLEITFNNFEWCEKLEEIHFPASLKLLDNAFTMDSLRDVYFGGMDAVIEPHCFAWTPSVTIHGYAGSTAEAYALEHHLRFEPIE